jgi:hypothetical protein
MECRGGFSPAFLILAASRSLIPLSVLASQSGLQPVSAFSVVMLPVPTQWHSL